MRRPLAVLLVLISAFLLFWRLDATPLWRDEGTTAVWARLMAESGSAIPWVYDFDQEQLLVQAPDGHDVNSKFLPAMQSYLQFYVSGAGFALLGADEWSARAPYALLGALALWLLYRVGRRLHGDSIWALAPPFLAVTSIGFLHAARQCRYYVIVILGATWLFLEIARYLQDRELAGRGSFYAKLAAAGFLIYFSNYVSFVGMWAALGLFVLATKDLKFIRGFCFLSAGMAAVILPEFFLLHAEFASSWPPDERPAWEAYQRAFSFRGRDYWRMFPLFLLLPAALWAARREGALRRPGVVFGALGTFATILPFWLDRDAMLDLSRPMLLLWWALCWTVPLGAWLAWRGLPRKGPVAQLALLAGLTLITSPLVALIPGKDKATSRHFYQFFPAGILLTAMAARELGRRAHPAAGLGLLAFATVWPNLDITYGGTDEVVPRQFVADRSYNGPLIDFLRENLEPGARVAFHRNVKGMAMYFYFPEMRWVGLLDADAPHNQQFRGRIPNDQFDDAADADWYVLWDTRGEPAVGLDPSRYEKVWEYSYPSMQSWWDRASEPGVRSYEVYRRAEGNLASGPG